MNGFLTFFKNRLLKFRIFIKFALFIGKSAIFPANNINKTSFS